MDQNQQRASRWATSRLIVVAGTAGPALVAGIAVACTGGIATAITAAAATLSATAAALTLWREKSNPHPPTS